MECQGHLFLPSLNFFIHFKPVQVKSLHFLTTHTHRILKCFHSPSFSVSICRNKNDIKILSSYLTKEDAVTLRLEGRRQGTIVKRMTQPLRKTGHDKNGLEPTRLKMAEDLTSLNPDPHYALIAIY